MKGDRLKLSAALVASCTIITLLAVAPAKALSCNDCVTSGDIVDGAVHKEDIGSGAVGGSEILNGSITGGDIASSTIGASKLGPSAKAAVGQVHLTGSTTSTAGAELDHFNVTVPSTGRLIVQIDGSFYQNVDAPPGGNSVIEWVEMAICTATASMSNANCGNSLTTYYSQDADSASGLSQPLAFSITRVFSVTAGIKTLYLNGKTSNASYSLNLYGGPSFDGATATAEFVPDGLTITTT